MGTSGYQKYVFESIRKVQSVGIFSEIHFVPTKLNVKEIPKVMEFAEKERIDMVSFLGLVPHGRTVKNIGQLVLSSEDIGRVKQIFQMKKFASVFRYSQITVKHTVMQERISFA